MGFIIGSGTILCTLLKIIGLRFGFFFRHRIDIAGNDFDSEINVVMQTRHVFDDTVFVKHVFGVQLVKNGVEFVLLLLQEELGVLPVGALGNDDAGQDDPVHRQEQEKVYGFEVNLFLSTALFHVQQYTRLSPGGELFFA